MAIIEGIGDEVIILLTLLVIFLMVALAWISTHVREPLLEIFIIDGSRIGNLIQRLQERRRGSARAVETTADGLHAQSDETENVTTNNETGSDSSENNTNTDNGATVENDSQVDIRESQNSGDNEEIGSPVDGEINSSTNDNSEINNSLDTNNSEPAPTSTSELRQRRLNFFKVNPLTEPSSSTQPQLQELSEPASTPASGRGEVSNEESATTSPDETVSSQGSPSTPHDDPTANDNTASEPPDGHIRVRLKYLDDRQKLVHASPDDTVAQFKRRHFAAELAENFIVRFIFNGQELRHDATLQSYNVQDNSVIHCLLSNQNNHSPRRDDQEQADLDIGRWMFPLFGLLLGLVWYYRIVYRNYFNAPTTLSLIGITFLYFTTLLATLRQDEDQVHR